MGHAVLGPVSTSALSTHGGSCVREASLHVIDGQVRVRGEQLAKIWLRGEEAQDKLNWDARSPNDGFSDHDLRIDGDAIQQRLIHSHRGLP